MSKEKNVVNYYVICNELKYAIRAGWKDWHVKSDRLESVAEHIYGVQMLAIAMQSEYQYDIDINKVILMLAIHELGETIIGDITQFEITKEEKEKIERESVKDILKDLLDGNKIEELFLEFDQRKTKEAIFAYQCDKLECDLQCKIYGEENRVDLSNQEGNKAYNHPLVKSLLDENLTWEEMWLKFGQTVYPYDDNFRIVSDYALKNNIKIKNKNMRNNMYKKLVRDKIPEKIKENNQNPIIRILADDEYKLELEKKLHEEYQEVLGAKGKERVEELADMLEVMIYLAKLEGKEINDIIDVCNKKHDKRGGFEKKIYLEDVE